MRQLWLPERRLWVPAPRRRRGFVGLGIGVKARPPVLPAIYNGLAAYYKFENTDWLDSTGRGNSLTGSGGPTVAAGKVGNGVALAAASTQYLSRAALTDIANLSSFWISAWVNAASLPANRSIAYTIKGDNSIAYQTLGVNSGGAVFFQPRRADNTTVTCLTATGVITTSAWYLVDAFVNGATQTAEIYVNGASAATTSLGQGLWQEASPKLIIGATRVFSELWDGTIDEVGYWTRVPTAAELAARYAAGAGLGLY